MSDGSSARFPQESIALPSGPVLRRRSLVSDEAFSNAVASDLTHLGEWLAWAQNPPSPQETAYFRALQDADWEAGRSFTYVLTPLDGVDKVIGGCAMFPNGAPGVLEIGYWICSPYIRQGLATEMAAALTAQGLALQGVARMEIHCDRANVHSAAIPPRIGYRLDRIEPDEPQTRAEEGQSMVWYCSRPGATSEGS